MDRFLVNLPDEASRDRGRLAVVCALILSLTMVVYAPIFAYIQGIGMGVVVVAIGVVSASLPWVLRRTGSIALAAHATGAMFCAFIFLSASWAGGAHGVALPVLVLVPMTITYLVDTRSAVYWSLGVSVVVLGWGWLQGPLGVLEMEHAFPEQWVAPSDATVTVAAIWMGLIITRAYTSYRDRVEQRLQAAEQVGALVDRFNDMEASLANATQRFAGGNGGLAADMLAQARLGQQQLRSSEERVLELLATYAVVEQQLATLLERAQAIESLMETSKGVGQRLDILSLHASLEAAHTQEASFALVAEEIGRVTGLARDGTRQIQQTAATFRQELAALGQQAAQATELGQETRVATRAAASSFDRLLELVDAVTHATGDLRLEASRHLDAVREIARTR